MGNEKRIPYFVFVILIIIIGVFIAVALNGIKAEMGQVGGSVLLAIASIAVFLIAKYFASYKTQKNILLAVFIVASISFYQGGEEEFNKLAMLINFVPVIIGARAFFMLGDEE